MCVYMYLFLYIFVYICMYIYIYICLPPLKPTGFDLFIVFYVDFLLFVAFKSRQRFSINLKTLDV